MAAGGPLTRRPDFRPLAWELAALGLSAAIAAAVVLGALWLGAGAELQRAAATLRRELGA